MDFKDKFMVDCTELVQKYYKERFNMFVRDTDIKLVWYSKVLQNKKALIAVVPSPDKLYFEVTYNGDKDETYLDIYEKVTQIIRKEVDSYE